MGTEISLLGDVTIGHTSSDGRPIQVPVSMQVRVAFAILTLERRHGVTRDALADTIWPDQLPPTWASALRTLVSRVRGLVAETLGQDPHKVLTAWAGTYFLRLPADTTVDVELAESSIFEASAAVAKEDYELAVHLAMQATDRLRAPFLPEHDGGWVTAQRERLHELFVAGLEALSYAAGALGDTPRAIAAATEAISRAPLRESAHRCLMSAHAGAGNRGEALRAYQRLRRRLTDELGVEPDAMTESLYLDLLGPPVSAVSRRTYTVRTPWKGGRSTPFAGREPEMALAAEAWSQALLDGVRVLVVCGDARYGEASFAMALAQRLSREGALALVGRCEEDANVPFQPFVQMLDPVLATTPRNELARLGREVCEVLATTFPSLAASPASQPAESSALAWATAKFLEQLAREHPLVVVLDDLHRADGPTALLLHQLIRTLKDTRLLVVAVAPDETPPHHPIRESFDMLDRDGIVHWIRLGRARNGTPTEEPISPR